MTAPAVVALKPQPSQERVIAWSRIEYAAVVSRDTNEMYAAIEAATAAAHKEGAEGKPYIPYAKPVQAPAAAPPEEGGYIVVNGGGFWDYIREMEPAPQWGTPKIVVRKGTVVNQETLEGVIAICPTEEAAAMVRDALNAAGKA